MENPLKDSSRPKPTLTISAFFVLAVTISSLLLAIGFASAQTPTPNEPHKSPMTWKNQSNYS